MKLKLHPNRKSFQKGGALVGTISATVLLGVMGASVIELSTTSQTTHLSANATSRAFYAAESGLSYAQNEAWTTGWPHGREKTLGFQGGEKVSVVRNGDYFWATSVVDPGTATEGRARVPKLVDGSDNGDPTPPPGSENPEGFVLFGDNPIYAPTSSVLEGNVAAIDEDVELRGMTDGNVYGFNIYITRTTIETRSTVSGDIYSSGCVYVQHADVEGDIQASGNVNVYGSYADVEGWIFSDTHVNIYSGAVVLGSVHADGDVCIESSAVVGSPTEPVEIRANGNVYLNSGAKVYGTIYAGGSVSISSDSSVTGSAYSNTTVSGTDRISESSIPNASSYLLEPIPANLSVLDTLKMPPADHFTAGYTDITLPEISWSYARYSLSPGTYRNVWSRQNNYYQRFAHLQLNAGASGDSTYVFNRLTFEEHTRVYLNLSGEHDIHIFVSEWLAYGNCVEAYASLDGVTYLPVTDPAVSKEVAARVFWEAHCGCSIGCYASFFGTVHSPFGQIIVGDYSKLYGAYYSGGGHHIGCSYFKQVMPNYFAEQEAALAD